MEICDFAYHRPTTVAAACDLAFSLGAEARFLAGGTELLIDLKQHRDDLRRVISLQAIPELREIRIDGDALTIGATATLTEVAEHPAVLRACPSLAEAILTMAAWQIRNRGTIGGNFCGAVPSADAPPICIALGASVRLISSKGERTIPAEEFFIGPRKTAVAPGELLAGIRVPLQPERSGSAYQRFSLRRSTALAVAGVAARIVVAAGTIRDARIALGAVAPVPMLARQAGSSLEGKRPTADVFSQAGRIAAEESRPISDLRGSAGFRRTLVEVLTARALAIAAERADGGRS